IHDRIELVSTRFEILKRDAEIELLRALLHASPADTEKLQRAFQERCKTLDADLQFLQLCNVGSENMKPEHQERVRTISRRYRWVGGDGEETDLLTADEMLNLTVARGTLSPEERKIVNHHIEVTIKMLEALPWPRHLQNVPEYAG